ncbi:MAG: tetratricopeptide repeat protein [Anaerolineae bacterium]
MTFSGEPTQFSFNERQSGPAAVRWDRNWLWLTAIWLVQTIALLLWLRLDNRFPVADAATQLTAVLRTADALAQPGADTLARVAAVNAGQPPLLALLATPLIWLFGRGADTLAASNALWLGLLLVSVFAIARSLWPTTRHIHLPALAAAALVSLYPLSVAATRTHQTALPVAALVALAVYLLLASDGLQHLRAALAFAGVTALGLTADAHFWAYVLGPALLATSQALTTPRPAAGSRHTSSRHPLQRWARRIGLADPQLTLLLVMVLLGGLFLLYRALYPATPANGQPQPGMQLGTLDDATGRAGLIALLIGLLYAVWQVTRPRTPAQRRAFGWPLVWLAVGAPLIVLLTRSSQALPWLPLLPAAALLTVGWLADLLAAPQGRVKTVGQLAAAVLAVAVALNAAITGWGAPAALVTALRAPAVNALQPFAASANASLFAPGHALYHRWPPQKEKAQTATIGQAINRLCGAQASCRTVVLACQPALSTAALNLFLTQAQLGDHLRFAGLATDDNYYFDLWDSDFVLLADSALPCASEDSRRATVATGLTDAPLNERFRQVETFPLPDGSAAALLRRVQPPLANLDPLEQAAALEHILSVTPNSAAATAALSQVLEQANDPVRALALREEMVARNPQDRIARIALGDAYLAYGRPQAAAEQYQAAIALTGDAAGFLKLAAAYEALADWPQAEAALTQAVQQAPDDYIARLRQGQFYAQRGQYGDATTALAAARRLDPSRYETYLALAETQRARGDTVQAQEQFQQAQQAAPDDPAPLLAWADALAAQGDLKTALDRYAEAAQRAKGNDDAVIEIYDHWIAALRANGEATQADKLAASLATTYPQSAAALALQGDALRGQQRLEEAATTYRAALALQPQDAVLRVRLAQTLDALGQTDAARAMLEEGLALPGGHAELLTAQADLLVAEGLNVERTAQAVQAYEAAQQINPAYWLASAHLAQLYLTQGRASAALVQVEAAAQRWPQEASLQALRGEALAATGRRQDAIAAYRAALDLAGIPAAQQAQLATALGELQLATGSFAAAEQSFQRALTSQTDDAAARVGLARLYTQLAQREAATANAVSAVATDANRFELARSALQTVLDVQPTHVAAQTALGDLYAAYGRADEAISAYQAAVTSDPAQAGQAIARLSALYRRANRNEDALTFFRQVLSDKPGNVAALRALSDAAVAAGQPQTAIEAFDLFLAQHRNNVDALMAQGSLFTQLGQPEQALTAYRRAAELSAVTGWVQPQLAQARTLASLGRNEDAETLYRALIQQDQDPQQAIGLTGNVPQAYTDLIQLLINQDRGDDAGAVVKQALTNQPTAAAVYLAAGNLSRYQGDTPQALKFYQRALELEPGNTAAQTRVGDLLLQSDNLADAQTAYEGALAGNASSVDALLGLARVLDRRVNADAGTVLTPEQTAILSRTQSLLDTALALQPDASAATQLLRADVLATQGNYSAAAEVYQAILLQAPDNASAIEGLARALLATGQGEQAIASYQAAADAAATPEERDRWLLAQAAAQRSLGQVAEAEQTYTTMLAAAPENNTVRKALGDLYLSSERLDAAIAQYQQIVEADPNDLATAFQLGRTWLRVGQLEQASLLTQAMLAASPSAYQPHLLAARIALEQDDAATALANLRQAESLAPTNGAALVLIGDTYLAAGRLDDAGSAYATALTLEPRSNTALIGLSRVYLARGRLEEAESNLRRALRANPANISATATLGNVLLRAGRAEEALATLEPLAVQQPDNTDIAQTLADAYLAAGRIDDGLALYRARLATDPATQALVMGQALLTAGQLDAGVEQLEQFAAANPDRLDGLLALAQGLATAGRSEQADATYQQAIRAGGDAWPPRILYGNFLLGQQQAERAATIFEEVIAGLEQANRLDEVRTTDAADTTDVALWQAWIGLARAQQQIGDFENALKTVQAGEALRPDLAAFSLQSGDILRALQRNDEALAAYDQAANLGSALVPLTRKGTLYLRMNEPDKALAAYEPALLINPGDVDALLGSAQAYAQRGAGVDQTDFTNAETRLKRAAEAAPQNAEVTLALGDLYVAYGRYSDAVTQYSAVTAAQPDNATASQSLVNALLAASQTEAALQEQQRRLTLAPEDRTAQLGLARIYRLLGRYGDAETVYRQVLTKTPDDPVALIALGDVYLAQGLPQQAIPSYEQALEHTSDGEITAQAVDQLGKAYLQQGNADAALKLAETQIADAPTLARGYLLLGSVREAQNDATGALAAYTEGIAQAEDTLALQLRQADLTLQQGRAADAQTLYEALTQSQPRTVDAYIGLARAHIAQLPDLRALRLEWAEQALRTALGLDPNATAAYVTQGDLYTALERPADAAKAYRAALASRAGNADDSTLRLKLADALAAADNAAAAMQEYQRAAIANPTNLGIQMTLANAYRQLNRPDRALAQYQHINRLLPSYPFAYIKQGELLDELGEADAALAAYQAAVQAAPNSADAVLTLASVYRKRGMIPEAVAAYETGLQLDPTREAARTALDALRAGGTPTP